MQTLPRTLKDFALYYWRFSPGKWALFAVQDIFHYSRYQISFVFIGMGVDALAQSRGGEGIPDAAWLAAVAVFLMLSVGEIMHTWTAYIMRTWKPALRAKIRSDFFNYALGHSHAWFQDRFAGEIARKVTEVAESSVRMHDHLRFSIFGSLVNMTAAMVVTFMVSPYYAAGLLVFVLSVTLPVAFRLRRIGGRSRVFSERRSRVTGTVVDILSNAASMRSFANAGHEISVHAADTAAEREADEKRILTLVQIEVYRRLSLVLLGGGMFVALLLGWDAGMVTIGQVSAVMGQTVMLVGSTWFLGSGVVMVADELGYIDDALRMITPEHGVTDRPGAKPLAVTEGRIEYRAATFRYPGQNVFEDLNIAIEPHSKVGLMGPSGAGKSSFVSLLLRLFDLQSGQIFIDGQDIAGVTQDSLRAQIAVIPQDTSLFHRSLADNIRYGRLDATDEEIIEAARRAHAHDFIARLPDGYNTLVGERGIKLSGGQRQRIAIARAILKNAPILILDEATSSLDSESEKLIQQSLAELMEGKTVIAIAHRLSTIAHLDRLIVMNEGRIAEQGTHAQLLARPDSLYGRLWRMQSGGFVA